MDEERNNSRDVTDDTFRQDQDFSDSGAVTDAGNETDAAQTPPEEGPEIRESQESGETRETEPREQADESSGQEAAETSHAASAGGGSIPAGESMHDFDDDEPRFDTQTGEPLNKPGKKYPGVLLTLAVTAVAVWAFVYSVMPGALPSAGSGRAADDVRETEAGIETEAAIETDAGTEPETAYGAASGTEKEDAAVILQAQSDTDMTESESDAGGEPGTESESDAGTEAETESEAETEAQTESESEPSAAGGIPEFKTEGIVVRAGLDVSGMVEDVMPGIVSVTCTSVQTVEDFFYGRRQIEETSAGSGVIIDEDDDVYYIVTDSYIVEDAQELTVGFSVPADTGNPVKDEDTIARAETAETDQATGLALLTVKKSEVSDEIRQTAKPAAVGDSDEVTVGEKAVAIGNALGYGLSVTEGVVSAVGREMTSYSGTHEYIQTDASVNYGNYGGALLNSAGEVIGINAGKITSSSVEGMGYALPVNDVMDGVDRMLGTDVSDQTERQSEEEETGSSSGQVKLAIADDSGDGEAESEAQQPDTSEAESEVQQPDTSEAESEVQQTDTAGGMLGVRVADVSAEYRIIYRIPDGVYIADVTSGSGAEEAGLQSGDIITAVNGEEIEDVEDLRSVLSETKAGDEAKVSYIRPDEDGTYDKNQVNSVTVILQ